MDRYIGKMLDNRYEILERIGTGGMAVVYKAKCHRLNRLVAVKILKDDLVQDADFRRRFNAESQAVAQLSHPNIVSVYDVSRGGDTEYIVMELMDGITLKQYMEKRGQLNWRESLHFITQIMRALSHAHSRGIVHRDIKPQNIMVLRDGSVKVTDFGIACLENSAQTLTQEALGSVHYISPEQARGDRTDARSDIYSAGVVLYEMLSGRLPFEGDSAVSVAIQHLSSIPLAPREINPDIPQPLELICMKAMASKIEKRYSSAEVMIDDLETFRKNPEVDLQFDMADLREDEVDEPTRPLRVASVAQHAAAAANNQSSRRTEQSRDRDRRRYAEEEPYSESIGKKIAQVGLTLVAVALAVALVGILFKSIMTSFEQQQTVVDQYVVKSVLGLTLDEARELPGVKDVFEIEVAADTVYSAVYEEGTIARQEPGEGATRKGNNTIITVWLSAGKDEGVMMDVSNTTVTQAKSELRNLVNKYNLSVLTLEEDKEYSNEITAGYVIRTLPKAGDTLKRGDTIHLIVSKGPELMTFPMPNFVGMQLADVQALMETTWHLTCTEADIEYVESDLPAGEVVWQSVMEETVVTEWDTIQLQVSAAAEEENSGRGLTLELPQDGRVEVMVEVYVGDETMPQYKGMMPCSDITAYVPLRGEGEQLIMVYFDGVLASELTHIMQFD